MISPDAIKQSHDADLANLWCVGTELNVGTWNTAAGRWDNLGNLGGWTLLSVAFDSDGTLWGVGTGHNVGTWSSAKDRWEDQGLLGGWTLLSIAFDANGTLWGVGTGHNVGRWNAAKGEWDDQGRLGGWTLLNLAFDAYGTLWAVGTSNNVGRWDAAKNGWDDRGLMGGWTLLSIAFDSSGTLWGVGTSNNIGRWDSITNSWIDQGKLGGWSVLDVVFATGPNNWNIRLQDVRRAFDAVPRRGELRHFEGPVIVPNRGKDHIQGMSSFRDYLFVVKNDVNSSRGTIVVLKSSTSSIVQKFDSAIDGYPHPDGGQVIGSYLAQAVENGSNGFVCFYYLGLMTDHTPPIAMPCRIACRGGAGAVGITDINDDVSRSYLVAVYDSSNVSFYKSNGKFLNDPTCAFTHLFTQPLPPFSGESHSKGADNICLVTDVAGQPFLIGFTSTAITFGIPREDWASLYAIDLERQQIIPVEQRHMVTSSGIHLPVLDGVAFRWGAGLNIISPTQLEFFCTSRNFTSLDFMIYKLTTNQFR
jgi:hypothetical protein